MSNPSLDPAPGDEAPIDAEFEPATPTPKASKAGRGGPGWVAFAGLVLVCLGLSAYSAGVLPGLKPGAADIAALQGEIAVLKSGQTERSTITDTIVTDVARRWVTGRPHASRHRHPRRPFRDRNPRG